MSEPTAMLTNRPSPLEVVNTALTKAIHDSLPELTEEQREFFYKLFPEMGSDAVKAKELRDATHHYNLENRLKMALDLINRTIAKNVTEQK